MGYIYPSGPAYTVSSSDPFLKCQELTLSTPPHLVSPTVNYIVSNHPHPRRPVLVILPRPPPSSNRLGGRTAIVSSVVLSDSFNTTSIPDHQPHCLRSSSLTNVVSPLQVPQCPKATPIPTTSNSLIIHQSSSWPPRCAISFLFLTATGVHPTQPKSLRLGDRQDTQQVVVFIPIVESIYD